MPKKKYNWIKIKNRWYAAETMNLTKFLEDELGVDRERNGGVERKTRGWNDDKKEHLREQSKKAEKELREELKIGIEDLLINKKLLFTIDGKYLHLLGRLSRGDTLKESEVRFLKTYDGRFKGVWKRLQVELGLPDNVSKLQGDAEKPIYLKELMREAEKIIDDENKGGSNNTEGKQKESTVGD